MFLFRAELGGAQTPSTRNPLTAAGSKQPGDRKPETSLKRTSEGLARNQMIPLSYSNKMDLYGPKKYVTSWDRTSNELV